MGRVLWFTGLSGAGKTTLAGALAARLRERGVTPVLLDGDALRGGLCRDLGFSREARQENLRRAAELARLLVDQGLTVLVCLISPYREDREQARRLVGSERFLEVHLDVPVEVCEGRDAKGLYARARAGEIPDFTGIDAPYEVPVAPDLALPAHLLGIEESVRQLLELLGEVQGEA